MTTLIAIFKSSFKILLDIDSSFYSLLMLEFDISLTRHECEVPWFLLRLLSKLDIHISSSRSIDWDRGSSISLALVRIVKSTCYQYRT
jgi:hypothetical protein